MSSVYGTDRRYIYNLSRQEAGIDLRHLSCSAVSQGTRGRAHNVREQLTLEWPTALELVCTIILYMDVQFCHATKTRRIQLYLKGNLTVVFHNF